MTSSTTKILLKNRKEECDSCCHVTGITKQIMKKLKRLDTMDLKKYKDSMRPLIVADMAALRELYGKESVT